MEPENSGSVTVALQIKKRTFLDDEIQLKALSRELGKASKDAVAVLVKMLNSPDTRLQMQAAIKLLEFDIDVKRSISTDQIQRIIAEIKVGGGTKTLELEDAGSKKPIVNFSEIRSIT